MPSGGARIGAGRKPKPKHDFEVIKGGADIVAFQGPGVTAEPPDDLPQDQHEFWQRYAGLAIERRTLIDHTVPAFRLLCELEAEKKAVKATLDRDGRTYIKCVVDGAGNEHQELKAHPLKSDYAKLSKQVETLMARFCLAPFGKPAGGGVRKTPAEQQQATERSKFFGDVARA